jgi:hypothetical protein
MEFLFEDRTKSQHILKFLEATEVGNRTSEKAALEREEERDDNWG